MYFYKNQKIYQIGEYSHEKKEKLHKLNKVIYFDESSATDYVQIIEGGELAQQQNY